jgi:hypothetical protein
MYTNGPFCLLSLLTSGSRGWRTRLTTHTQELEGFEALARNHRHQLHLAEEADFVRR